MILILQEGKFFIKIVCICRKRKEKEWYDLIKRIVTLIGNSGKGKGNLKYLTKVTMTKLSQKEVMVTKIS
jgi:hypothetical protein